MNSDFARALRGATHGRGDWGTTKEHYRDCSRPGASGANLVQPTPRRSPLLGDNPGPPDVLWIGMDIPRGAVSAGRQANQAAALSCLPEAPQLQVLRVADPIRQGSPRRAVVFVFYATLAIPSAWLRPKK